MYSNLDKTKIGAGLSDLDELARQKSYIEEAKCLVAKIAEEKGSSLTCHVATFGCQMNARDSEKLLGILIEAGYQPVETEDADLVVYNTCTVRDNANQKVYGRLGVLNGKKKKNPLMKIALCGCMTQEPSAVEKIKTSYPFVDLIFGTHNIFTFAELLCKMLKADKRIESIWQDTTQIVEDLPIERKFKYKTGVNIMFGCNNFCSYCIVPYVRGRERSRAPEEIIEEIKKQVADGVIEVMLLGQNVSTLAEI